ncbi:uncharacterized protein LOC107430082 isoform X1 [Ziziphus jujuba]|uniref:Uncharacterized protein LOC107430082 isoform X1 n=1 Tax=Ziziphus jujuba TaxID=326968 RepID=A0A6P4B320_ZIZJJ|nr:uncharacterized protein LOC107430082 isoform X1 [Ziziphus jujuba]
MIRLTTLSCTSIRSSSALRPPSPSSTSTHALFGNHRYRLKPSFLQNLEPYHYQRKIRDVTFRVAGLSDDAPFAVAIGASMLTSLLFPVTGAPDDDSGDSAIDSTDSRFAVMGIISFIPYFNWLSWVFAWLDTGKRRYAVYSLVYLAPYLRSNLSLSPEESWLPIASILFCIIHVQLEASIKNGDLQGFQLFSEALKRDLPKRRKKDRFNVHQGKSEKETKSDDLNLPSGDDQSRNKIRGWEVPKKSHDNERLDDERNEDERRKH